MTTTQRASESDDSSASVPTALADRFEALAVTEDVVSEAVVPNFLDVAVPFDGVGGAADAVMVGVFPSRDDGTAV